ncbi:MAG: hypothetical protein L0H10_07995 [Comamonas sp.]|uniref:hypothetical protein n=1 Tax=Comamonas sp. TaxID=34028 RepID=UPI0026470CA2|nr:hypothetical protein [Comamonas sp.]MDN5503749.1 hypothetical protein [Comamonas sp.]MDN5538454.1 hypothetical protein [Comamonas sp.]
MSKNSAPTAYKHSKYITSNHIEEKSKRTAKFKPSKVKQPPVKLKPSLTSTLVEAPATVQSMAIDKLYLDLALSAPELEAVASRAASLKAEGKLSRGSNQGTFFQMAYCLKLESGAIARLHLIPSGWATTFNFQFVLNPNQMASSDCEDLILLMKSLFPTTALKMMRNMLVRRTDLCIELAQLVDMLLIELDGARSGSKIFVSTDRGAKLQTMYLGSVTSRHHGIAYDLDASDDFKRQVGEKPSRVKLADDAELSFTSTKGRTRLESRRVFRSAPVTLAELATIKDPFGDYRIMKLKPQAFKNDLGFCNYIECVRIRGINGARKYLLANCGGKAISAQVSAWESKLASMTAVWWKPEQYAASLLETLKQSAAWKFIRPMARSKTND